MINATLQSITISKNYKLLTVVIVILITLPPRASIADLFTAQKLASAKQSVLFLLSLTNFLSLQFFLLTVCLIQVISAW